MSSGNRMVLNEGTCITFGKVMDVRAFLPNSLQVALLLVWQFSKPVVWALLIALPAAWFASKSYLEFFADRIDTPILILLVSGLVAVLLSWGTVAGHAWRISRSSPILALRYE